MPLGFGYAPIGTSPSGYGVTDSANSPLNAILPDVSTGLTQTGRVLNLGIGDYAFTADGRVQGMGTVPQLVQLALTTVFASSAVPTLGQRYTRVSEQGPNIVQQLTAEVTRALSDVITRNWVSLLSVVVQPIPANPDGQKILVKWKDLTTGKTYTTPVGP